MGRDGDGGEKVIDVRGEGGEEGGNIETVDEEGLAAASLGV